MNDAPLQPVDPAALPDTVTRYLRAHEAGNTVAAIAVFTEDATVTDDGRTHTGTTAIEEWLNHSAGGATYTLTLTGAYRADATHYVADHRLEGSFPGGVVDLHFRFTLRGDAIERLVIEP